MQSLVIEAWVPAHCVLTPSLILHNLALQGIQTANDDVTISIDRGHYDCTNTNYAVILVEEAQWDHAPQHSVYCSLFSRSATRDMDANALYPHWLGNCYVHLGDAMCSYRHESGHAKTWRKLNQPNQPNQPNQSNAVSVEPVHPSPTRRPTSPTRRPTSPTRRPTSPTRRPTSPKKKTKNNLRIIQLQKKNLLLRTEVDVLKSEQVALRAEFRDLKAELSAVKEALGTVKEDQVGLAQRHKEQEAATKRANQCMRDWINLQIIERVCILETQQKQQHQQQQQSKKTKFSKKCKKEMKRLSERLVLLENMNNRTGYECNKCCNNETISWNPFDFKTIYDDYDQRNNAIDVAINDAIDVAINDAIEDECPALDLIVNHYADFVPSSCDPCTDDDDDDDMFEVIQIDAGSEFNFDLPK